MSSVFRVKKTKDYTVMSNYHIKDKRLSWKAKGILSEMLSLPPDWDYTLTGLASLAADGIDSVRSGIRELEKNGYLKRRQLRDETGKMSNNEYLVYEQPDDNPDWHGNESGSTSESPENKGNLPSLENPTTAKEPSTEKPSLENPITENPITENPTQLNTNILNTKELNTQSYLSGRADDEIDMIERYRSLIYENIDYDVLKQQHPASADKIDEIVENILECVCSKKKAIRIGGDNIPQKAVKSRMLKINSTHIEYILECLNNNSSDVKNIKSYLLTVIYNAPTTIDNYYSAAVNHDMRTIKQN